jgi:hypothetical protein
MTKQYRTPWWEVMEEAQGSATEVECWIAEPRIPGVRRLAYYGGDSKPLAYIVYRELVGHVPAGWSVRAKCGNNDCVNPRHLELTDTALGVQVYGRTGKRLSEAEVKEIRKHGDSKVATHVIARRYDITGEQVRRIVARKCWKSIPE